MPPQPHAAALRGRPKAASAGGRTEAEGPQVGEFQCYDQRALKSLREAAAAVGHPEWGHGGPDDAGHYTSTPEVRLHRSRLLDRALLYLSGHAPRRAGHLLCQLARHSHQQTNITQDSGFV